MLKKLLCKIGLHNLEYKNEIDLKKFNITSKKLNCNKKFWKCRWCDLTKDIK